MKAFESMNTFRPQEAYLIDDKIKFLLEANSPESLQKQLRRVFSIANIPDFDAAAKEGRIDLSVVLDIRDEPECAEFRSWLWDSGDLSDEEIRARLRAFNAWIARRWQGLPFRVLKFLGLTAVGLAGPVGGVFATGVGALDEFLIQRLLTRDGVAAFLNEKVPSVFQKASNG